MELSPTARRVLREIARRPNAISHGVTVNIGGDGRAPWLSAARALVRRGLLYSPGGSRYGLTDAGKPIARAELERHDAQPRS